MRAKIIQYNGTAGEGIALAEGSQYDFTIRHWRSDTSPATGQTIEITLDDGQVAAIFLVGKDVLAKELASRVGANISQGIASGQMPSVGAIGFDPADIVTRVGKPALIAFAVFVVALLFMQVATISVFGQAVGFTMWGAFSYMGGSAFLQFLFLFALIAPVVPIFLRHPFAWFALGAPLLFYVVTSFSVMSDLNAASKQMDQIGLFGKDVSKQMAKAASDALSIGFGAYLGVTASLVMAAFGFLNFRRDAHGVQEMASPLTGIRSMAAPVMTVTEPIEEAKTAMAAGATGSLACLKCGGKSALDAKFCGHCGHAF